MKLRNSLGQLKEALSDVEKRVIHAKQCTYGAKDQEPDYQFDYAQEKLVPSTVKRGKSLLSIDSFVKKKAELNRRN